ncbi:D-galactonate dehydratase family protein [Polaribacter haliotis]|uniref:D-galactonate dehydratase family protein n=1 Tax=Polaribacter haliotis TaxID=1888915 RepID=A0A7L8AGL4_9FLAO|nr:D-mannonate dehydratase ManD [Polaribacter haliotis]QOD60949.1 D-galactonate dehydratase family protein [Polaribacter haliotis]
MKIKDIKVFVCSPGRNFVTIKITTEEGIYGIGDATLNGREMAVATYLEEHIAPCLIGKDASQIEDIWQYLYKGAYWRKGPVTMTAIGAIDMALWDIKGKKANMPVYQLLGGKSRKGVTVYGHANGETIDEVLNNLGTMINQGYKVVRLQCSIPNLKGTYGTLEGKKNYYELQGDRPLPPEQQWSTSKYMNFIPELFKQARERFGYEIGLCHDVHSRLTPIEASRLGKLLEPYNLLFMEDTVTSENPQGYKIVREHTVVPLAVGEIFSTVWDAKVLIENQWIDYLRTAVSHGGGITPLRKISDFADMHHVRMAPHGAPDQSPICFMAQMNFNLWVPNFGIQEFIGFGTEKLNEVFKYDVEIKEGLLYMEDKPGLGVEFDEEAAKKYPYKRSYLPVNRLEDGTLWNW